jgi:hypothetical protein
VLGNCVDSACLKSINITIAAVMREETVADYRALLTSSDVDQPTQTPPPAPDTPATSQDHADYDRLARADWFDSPSYANVSIPNASHPEPNKFIYFDITAAAVTDSALIFQPLSLVSIAMQKLAVPIEHPGDVVRTPELFPAVYYDETDSQRSMYPHLPDIVIYPRDVRDIFTDWSASSSWRAVTETDNAPGVCVCVYTCIYIYIFIIYGCAFYKHV